MNIDRNIQAKLQVEIREALSAIAKKYGLDAPSVDLRRARDGSMVRLMKLDMHVATAKSNAENAKAAKINPDADPALIRALDRLGVTKISNRKGEKVIAYKPNRPKYPFVFQGPRGGKWKATNADIIAMFG